MNNVKKILGVKINDISKTEALIKVTKWLDKGDTGPHIIFTPGPEFLVTAQKDRKFQEILNNADLSLPDGIGLQVFGGIKNRVPGVDFMLGLCQLSASKGWTIKVIGKTNGLVKDVTAKTMSKLRLMYPNIKIDNKKPDILFVGLGHPAQEKLIWKLQHITHLPRRQAGCPFRVAMGVGGALDYISGEISRPGKFLQTLGLEWLGRLFNQSFRIKRIFKATIVFPFLVFKEKIGLNKP